MYGTLFLLWLLVVIITILLVIYCGGTIVSGVALALIIGLFVIFIFIGITNQNDRDTEPLLLSFIFAIVTFVYLLIYTVYMNYKEIHTGKI